MQSIKNGLIILIITFISGHSSAQYLSKDDALDDVKEFRTLLKKESSYYQLLKYDFTNRFAEIEHTIMDSDSVPIHFLAYEFEKLIAETIDRHANIRMSNFDERQHEILNLYFPLSLAYFNGNVVGLKPGKQDGTYQYYTKKFPFLKSVDGIPIHEFLNEYAYRSKNSPLEAKISGGLKEMGDFGRLYFKQGQPRANQVHLTFTNGKTDKTIKVPLSDKKSRWLDLGSLRVNKNYNPFDRDEHYDLHKLDTWLTDSIAYLALPAMVSYNSKPDLEAYLKNTMTKFNDAKALIIDVRSNGGGTRQILNTLSGYFVQPEQTPWVANVAYIRSDQRINEDMSSMQSRFLYNYNSRELSDTDRKAIDTFNKEFKPEHAVDPDKFSRPFYMVLRSNEKLLSCPIYILVNEESFSAASVFTSAFKGLPNVSISGINTNGSSGRSVLFYLKHSNIRVRLSTMLSFQRNGKTLDGNGTAPDIVIEKDIDQIFGKKDAQLAKLIELIQQND